MKKRQNRAKRFYAAERRKKKQIFIAFESERCTEYIEFIRIKISLKKNEMCSKNTLSDRIKSAMCFKANEEKIAKKEVDTQEKQKKKKKYMQRAIDLHTTNECETTIECID